MDVFVDFKKDKNNICNLICINNNVINIGIVFVIGYIGFVFVICNFLLLNSLSNVFVICKLKFYWYYLDILFMIKIYLLI